MKRRAKRLQVVADKLRVAVDDAMQMVEEMEERLDTASERWLESKRGEAMQPAHDDLEGLCNDVLNTCDEIQGAVMP